MAVEEFVVPYWRPTTLDGVRAWSRMEAPNEACGFILRCPPDSASARFAVVVTARNDHEKPEHNYLIHAGDHLGAINNFGEDIIGIWHSHVDVDCQLSTKDLAFAMDGWLYMVYSVRDDDFSLVKIVNRTPVGMPVLIVP